MGDDFAASGLWAMFLGDAIAMPVHWYYTQPKIAEDFNGVPIQDFVAPKQVHPDVKTPFISSQWDHGTTDIIGRVIQHGKRNLWLIPGTHYHQGMPAGDNTLNLKLLMLLLKSIRDQNVGSLQSSENKVVYNPLAYLKCYIDYMTMRPNAHNDVYVELCHRQFFTNLVDHQMPLVDCPGAETNDTACGGGLILPLALAIVMRRDLGNNDDNSAEASFDHILTATLNQMRLTHKSKKLEAYWIRFLRCFLMVYGCKDLDTFKRAVREAIEPDISSTDLTKLKHLDDVKIIGKEGLVSPACYIDGALPGILLLALKYGADLKSALLANTNVGGDNCHRGAILGALIGCAFGSEVIPPNWPRKLVNHDGIRELLK